MVTDRFCILSRNAWKWSKMMSLKILTYSIQNYLNNQIFFQLCPYILQHQDQEEKCTDEEPPVAAEISSTPFPSSKPQPGTFDPVFVYLKVGEPTKEGPTLKYTIFSQKVIVSPK